MQRIHRYWIKYKEANYGIFKSDVADLVISVLIPIQKKYYELLENNEIDKILDDGLLKTSQIAKVKYELLKEKVGLHR